MGKGDEKYRHSVFLILETGLPWCASDCKNCLWQGETYVPSPWLDRFLEKENGASFQYSWLRISRTEELRCGREPAVSKGSWDAEFVDFSKCLKLQTGWFHLEWLVTVKIEDQTHRNVNIIKHMVYVSKRKIGNILCDTILHV